MVVARQGAGAPDMLILSKGLKAEKTGCLLTFNIYFISIALFLYKVDIQKRFTIIYSKS
jgi:hypothetical protein